MLLELLQDVQIVIRNRMWYRYEGAATHFSADVGTYLNAMFEARWIERGGPVSWPPDYFLWVHLKHLVYETPLDSDEDLIACISEVASRIRELSGVFECVRQTLSSLNGY